jgi:ubiquinone/menaquinone biosynthesis C-methylase UbiE
MRARSDAPELLDLEVPPESERGRILGYLSFVNRRLGGRAAVEAHLKGEVGSVLDVAGGDGDLVRELAERNPGLRPVVLDLSEWVLPFARVPKIRGDVRWLPLRDRSVDWVIATHFFHHLTDEQCVGALREFDRVARKGIVVNDLLRTRRALFWITLFTLFANRYVKFDGPQSVRRGFRPEEAQALADRAGLPWLQVRTHFGHRFTLAGRRPG